jgi:hypothetical protein
VFAAQQQSCEAFWSDADGIENLVAGLLSETTIAAPVEATNFSRLQAEERASGFVEKPYKMAAFFREGRADGWQDTLTPRQAARLAGSKPATWVTE